MVAALSTLSTQLSAAQLGITVTNLLIGFMAEPSIARLIDGPLASVGFSEDAAEGVALIDRAGARDRRHDGVRRARPEEPRDRPAAGHRACGAGLPARLHALDGDRDPRVQRAPRTRSCGGSASSRRRSWRRRARPRSWRRSCAARREQGTLELETATLLQRSLTFGDRRAADVMTPRVRVQTAARRRRRARGVCSGRARPAARASRCSAAESGEVVGVVHVKHAMSVPHERRARGPGRRGDGRAGARPVDARARPAAGDAARRRPADGRRRRRVGRLRRHRDAGGPDRGDRRRRARRVRPAATTRSAARARAPGTSPGCCAPTRSPPGSASCCPRTRSTRRSAA